ncbi:MAG: amino acid transporter, partial [Actinobacteria bacterium]|nr:amino acid transporter [Actinomycetota bacterium]
DALGVVGQPSAPERFLPYGPLPVLTTAALVFTSYLGFAQVATVAGEMKQP